MSTAIRQRDTEKLLEGIYSVYAAGWQAVTSRHPLGTNVYDAEWDVLIVLDACRVDALREVADEYDFLGDIDSIWSVGSNSQEWYLNTFTGQYAEAIAKTALITSNPNAEAVLKHGDTDPRIPIPFSWTDWSHVSEEAFAHIEYTRQHERPFDDLGDDAPTFDAIQDPNYITDRAIAAGRNDYEKIIVHYFQPHRPFVDGLIRQNQPLSVTEESPYRAVQAGEITKSDLWAAYLDNLRLALGSIEILLENIDAEDVIITSDHGELLGEFGQYGHFFGLPHPDLKRVPWVRTSANDQRTRNPKSNPSIREDVDVTEQLESLGYL
ncbi:hypothetical protein [Natronomonas gomsonensis]|uniref:hypothetical protein n=1 Tax=Natronomonas gomsonensis TaxID=1046043 RepID=UPI0015B91FB8|nr:hypothetical protein [Natronomonas gomsonensis]